MNKDCRSVNKKTENAISVSEIKTNPHGPYNPEFIKDPWTHNELDSDSTHKNQGLPLLIIEIGHSQRRFSMSLTLISLGQNMPTLQWHMWQMSMKNQLLSTAFASLSLKNPPGSHVHTLSSQSIWLLHKIFARQPRVLPLLLILIYTPLYLKWKNVPSNSVRTTHGKNKFLAFPPGVQSWHLASSLGVDPRTQI